MNKVLNITDRLKDKKKKHRKEIYHQKTEAVLRIVQCSSCQLSCAMCGSHLDTTDSSCPQASSHPDLNLCESCRAEFDDFLEMSKEKKGSDIFWHNKEWMDLWSAWLHYRKAIEEFRHSNEFKRLIKEPDK